MSREQTKSLLKGEAAGRGTGQVMDNSRREAQKETGRVKSFSDGVIAIAITLLILEIKIPKPDEIASVSLFIKLLDLWPSFLAFVTSFATILVMWTLFSRFFHLKLPTSGGSGRLGIVRETKRVPMSPGVLSSSSLIALSRQSVMWLIFRCRRQVTWTGFTSRYKLHCRLRA